MLNIFKKDKPNVWKILAAELDAEFFEGISWRSDRTEISYKSGKIVFDNYRLWSESHSQIMTRVVSPIIVEDGFRFEIYRKTFVRTIEKIFGAQDIEIGRKDFDNEFIIKASNELKVKTFFQSQEIRNMISLQKEVNIEISDKKGVYEEQLPNKHFELCYYADGEITNIEQLKSLLMLFQLMLDKLYEMKIINSA